MGKAPLFEHKLRLRTASSGTTFTADDAGSVVFEGYDYVGASTGDFTVGASSLEPDSRILGLITGDALVTSTYVNGQDRFWPFIWARDSTINNFYVEHTTGAAAGQNYRFAIYTNISRTHRYPGDLLFDSGAISTAAAPTFSAISSGGLTLLSGQLLWAAFNISSATPSFRSIPAAAQRAMGTARDVAGQDIDSLTGFTRNRAFAAFPDPYPSDGTAVGARQVVPAIAIDHSA